MPYFMWNLEKKIRSSARIIDLVCEPHAVKVITGIQLEVLKSDFLYFTDGIGMPVVFHKNLAI